LFLGIGEWERLGARPGLIACFALLALALAGAPLTGGAAAKAGLSTTLATLPNSLSWLFVAAALGTTLLMMRLVWLLTRVGGRFEAPYGPPTWPWLVLVALALWLPFYPSLTSVQLGDNLPLIVGLLLGGLAWILGAKGHRPARFAYTRLLPSLRLRRWREGWLLAMGKGINKPTLPSIAPPARLDRATPSLATAGATWLWMFLLLLLAFLLPG
jgi:hypothetical protein